MPVYQLIKQMVFPPPGLAEPDGLLAVGGDLSPQRLLLAYSSGIFPWFNEGEPILWWSPDPRCIFEPAGVHVSRSLSKVLRREDFTVTFNRAFLDVMRSCGEVRKGPGGGTWITEAMVESYYQLHQMGFAHSVECWRDGELAGGLYGVSLGKCFFGESMFHRRTDASKVALVTLAERLTACGYAMIDCQLPTPHLASLGAREIPRAEYLDRLVRAGVRPATTVLPAAFPC